MGVPSEVILEMQKQAKDLISVENIQEKLSAKVNSMINSTSRKTIASASYDLDMYFGMNRMFNTIFKMALFNQVDLMNEPLFSSLLYNIQLNRYVNLKKKARILIPKSCVLIAVADDTGTIQEGEIFLQIYKGNQQQSTTGEQKLMKDFGQSCQKLLHGG